MFDTIKVHYQSTHSAYEANKFLSEIRKHPIIAWDLEVATRYTCTELEECQEVLDDVNRPKLDHIKAQSILNATALGHPSHCTVTHCSIAISESEAYVFIMANPQILNLVFNYLVSTPQVQVLHNASYDFKHLYYHTGNFPKNYEDTALLSKTLLNHVNTWKASVKLKELAGRWYGDWAISADNFDVSQMYEPHVLKYSAVDSCATMKIFTYINEQCDLLDVEITDEFYTKKEGVCS